MFKIGCNHIHLFSLVASYSMHCAIMLLNAHLISLVWRFCHEEMLPVFMTTYSRTSFFLRIKDIIHDNIMDSQSNFAEAWNGQQWKVVNKAFVIKCIFWKPSCSFAVLCIYCNFSLIYKQYCPSCLNIWYWLSPVFPSRPSFSCSAVCQTRSDTCSFTVL